MHPSYNNFQQDQNTKFNQNKSNIAESSLNRMKHFLPSLDNQSKFLFSHKLITTKHNVPHCTSQLQFQEMQRCYKTVSSHFFQLPPIEKKSIQSTEMEITEFIPHEIDLPSPKSSSSPLSSRVTECWQYLLSDMYQNLENENVKEQRVLESKWGRGMTLDIKFWEDDNAPVVKIKSKEDIDSNTQEGTNVLTNEMIAGCLSFLSKSPESGLYVLNKCELMRMNLRDISILRYYHYLQYIDLTNNDITDLSPLGEIPYLIYLNAARNELTNVLRFTPPWYLTYVNLAHNRILKIDNLSEFWSIVRLDLSHNAIENIEGLENLKHLRFLNLGYNLIECVENLDNLNIQELNLEYNCISDFKSTTPEFGITLPNLRTLILRHNKLSTLEFFKGVYGLRYIDLKCNKIVDLLEVAHLKSLVYEVDFRGNPCTKWPTYRDVVLFSMPSVMFVDGASVTLSEKVSASIIFAPPMELIVARSITKLMLLEHLNKPNIDLHITPIDQSTPPLIILSGPPAVKKSILARQIADRLSHRVRYCASHTTKNPANTHCDKSHYHFVSREEFNEMTRRGEFLSTVELLGNSYGFHVSKIADLVLEKKIGITHMDLHAALQMQGRYTNAKLILVLTKNVGVHRQWIQEKFEVSTWIKTSLQNLVTIEVGKHRRTTAQFKESFSNKVDFVDDTLTELIKTLDLSPSSSYAKPQQSEIITKNSQIMFPKTIKTESEIEMDKRHISFRREGERSTSASSNKVTIIPNKPAVPSSDGLKIILDEYSNVIVENEEQRKERKKAKILLHHNSLHLQTEANEFVEDEEFQESVSSEDLLFLKPDLQRTPRLDSPEVLKQLYSELVIKSRDIYLQHHLENLGCFSLVVFTDEFLLTYNHVVNFIYEFYINQPLRKPIFSTEFEKLMQAIIPSKTEAFLEELTKYINDKLNSD